MDEATTERFRLILEILVIRHHQRHRHRQFAAPGASQQVEQAVTLLAHEDRHPAQLIGEVEARATFQPPC